MGGGGVCVFLRDCFSGKNTVFVFVDTSSDIFRKVENLLASNLSVKLHIACRKGTDFLPM